MRIVGGRLRGRALSGPSSMRIRPTSDRLRETIFNVLAHGYDDAVREARVLDLFAGTGAMAFEALSRGARFALMVDDGIEARSLIRANTENLGLGGSSRLFRRDATKLGALPANLAPFTLVFCDPPYGQDLSSRALASALQGGWLENGALIVVEEERGAEVVWPEGVKALERRDYGETQVLWGRVEPIMVRAS